MSADTLRLVLDFCYSGTLPEDTDTPTLALLLRAANKFLMPRLQAVCKVHVTASLRVEDNGLFQVYEAARELADEDSVAVVSVRTAHARVMSRPPLLCCNARAADFRGRRVSGGLKSVQHW